MSTTTEDNVRTVEQVARDHGYGTYGDYARRVGQGLPTTRPITTYDVHAAIADAAIGVEVPGRLIYAVVEAVNGQSAEPVSEDSEQPTVGDRVYALAVEHGASPDEVEGVLVEAGLRFDKDHAVRVLSRYASDKGFNASQTEAALVEVGLVEPTPEPEPEQEEDEVGALKRTVQRLVDFARGHGFRD